MKGTPQPEKHQREGYENTQYQSLNEFIYEFEKLLQHEKDVLSSESIRRNVCLVRYRVVEFGDDIPIILKWSSCDEGEQENQLSDPWGLSIDCISDRIYVADWGTHRVQIFSGNGEWIKCLKDEFLKEPDNILTLHNSMFVQCYFDILRFNTSTLKRESHKHYEHFLSGICTDNNRIFVGDCRNMKLVQLSLELKEEKRISLITDFKQNTTYIRDLSFARNEFYVLLTRTVYSIQYMSFPSYLQL